MAFLVFPKTPEHQCVIKRAFDLADSGQFGSVKLIKEHLQREGYDAYMRIHGQMLTRQLRERINLAAAKLDVSKEIVATGWKDDPA